MVVWSAGSRTSAAERRIAQRIGLHVRRNPIGAGVHTTSGPFLKSTLPVAGFALIEAANVDEVIAQVANAPCAVAHEEVWPLDG
jgi:hypothetical protein